MSKPNIREYIHLYLGCECYCTNKTASKDVIYILRSVGALFCEVSSEAEERTFRCSADQVKPILRPLSDMTEEEAIECAKLSEWEPHFRRPTVERTKYGDLVVKWDGAVEGGEQQNVTGDLFWCPDQFQYLLSKHFDLFELIVYDLAIDKTKLATHAPS